MIFKKLKSHHFTDIEDYKDYRKQKFIFFGSLFFLATFIGFGLSSWYINHNYPLAILDFSAAAGLLANMIYIYFSRRTGTASYLMILLLFIPQVALIIDGGFFNFGIVWCLCLPVIAYFLKGKKQGIIIMISMLLLIAVTVLAGHLGYIQQTYTFSHYGYIAVVFILISVLTFFYAETTEKSEGIIKNQLYNHSVTGLPNQNRLKLDLSGCRIKSFILLNIDNFKLINDFYGNKVGDTLLIEIAGRIDSLGIRHMQLYKLHSDEFAALIFTGKKRKASKEQLQKAAAEIKKIIVTIEKELKKPYKIGETDILLDFTMGISIHSDKPISEAAMALHHAKQRRCNFLVYDDSMDISGQYERNIIRTKNLKDAINFDNIILHYQPIIDNTTARIVSYESLIRLMDGKGKLLFPGQFMDIARKSKLYPLLTRRVIHKAFQYFTDTTTDFSINLSVDDIYNTDLLDFILSSIKEYNIGSQVILEFTESEKIECERELLGFIEAVKKQGCRIAIDDFGAGYSNYVYILNMSIDFLKIDGSLIKDLDTSSSSRAITETIVDFTRRLNIATVAEFVHSEEIFQAVKNMGITYSQGNYIGEPHRFVIDKDQQFQM